MISGALPSCRRRGARESGRGGGSNAAHHAFSKKAKSFASIFFRYLSSTGSTALTNSAVYQKGTAAVYPIIDLQTPGYVLSQASTTNSAGGYSIRSMRYGGMQQHLRRSIQLGFSWIEQTDQMVFNDQPSSIASG